MKRFSSPFCLPPRWRWLTWPVLIFSGGGIAVTLWLEEAALVECAPVAALFGMGALLYWFNHLVFKAAMPRPEDLSRKSTFQDAIHPSQEDRL